MNEKIVLDKSYQFALHIVQVYRKLADETHEYVLSKNLLSDRINVGAYVEAAQGAESRAASPTR
jgi:hypothetical protein